MVNQALQDLQSRFEPRRTRIHDREQIRIDFTNKFPSDRLNNVLSLETYVIGKPDTFCYWVEQKTTDLGRMAIPNAGYYGIYFDHSTQKYRVKDGNSTKEVDDATAQTIFNGIKAQLVSLIGYAKANDIDSMLKVSLYRHFKEKILSLYLPDKYLAIFLEDHIDHFLRKLGLFNENVEKLDPIRKKQVLMDFKNADPIMKSWLPYEYVDFLYEMFPPTFSELTGIWLEKTIRMDRKDREQGDFAVGKALWSPQRDKRGADIYRNMRLIKKGDVILHMVDDKAIVGISKVEEEYNSSFKCLPGTEWSKERALKAMQEIGKDVIQKQEFLDKLGEVMMAEEIELKDDWQEKTWENVKKWANKLVDQ